MIILTDGRGEFMIRVAFGDKVRSIYKQERICDPRIGDVEGCWN